MQEELGVTPAIDRPLWIHQSFFTEDVDHLRYHELCIYFHISATDIIARGPCFTCAEGSRIHRFEWLPFERLESMYFYPLFLKREIFRDTFTIRTDVEG